MTVFFKIAGPLSVQLALGRGGASDSVMAHSLSVSEGVVLGGCGGLELTK